MKITFLHRQYAEANPDLGELFGTEDAVSLRRHFETYGVEERRGVTLSDYVFAEKVMMSEDGHLFLSGWADRRLTRTFAVTVVVGYVMYEFGPIDVCWYDRRDIGETSGDTARPSCFFLALKMPEFRMHSDVLLTINGKKFFQTDTMRWMSPDNFLFAALAHCAPVTAWPIGDTLELAQSLADGLGSAWAAYRDSLHFVPFFASPAVRWQEQEVDEEIEEEVEELVGAPDEAPDEEDGDAPDEAADEEDGDAVADGAESGSGPETGPETETESVSGSISGAAAESGPDARPDARPDAGTGPESGPETGPETGPGTGAAAGRAAVTHAGAATAAGPDMGAQPDPDADPEPETDPETDPAPEAEPGAEALMVVRKVTRTITRRVTRITRAIDRPIDRTIIITLYRSAAMLLPQLEMLAPALDGTASEVIVVVNAPEGEPDLLADRLAAFGQMHDIVLTVYLCVGNSGFAAANNFAAAQARGAVLIFMNPDIFPPEGQEAQALAFLDGDPGEGLDGALLYYGDGTLMHSGMYTTADRAANPRTGFFKPVLRVEHYGKGLAAHVDDDEAALAAALRDVPEDGLLVTAALWRIRKAVFDEMGGLSTDYVIAYYEDADFCLRMLEAGRPVRVDRTARWLHLEGAGAGASDALRTAMWLNRGLYSSRFAGSAHLAPVSTDLTRL